MVTPAFSLATKEYTPLLSGMFLLFIFLIF